jgi:hypothetical protein
MLFSRYSNLPTAHRAHPAALRDESLAPSGTPERRSLQASAATGRLAANVELSSTHEGTSGVLALAAGEIMEQFLARGCPDKPSSPRASGTQCTD